MQSYEVLRQIGEGTYGIVYKARHKVTGAVVAIKKFKESDEDQEVVKTAMREISILRKLQFSNIVNLLTVFQDETSKIYLVFQYVGHTVLDELEKDEDGMHALEVKKLMWQLLRATLFMHKRGVSYANAQFLHRDIKPENLLISSKRVLKICDFGWARDLEPASSAAYTDYVSTRWYRAPELLVGDAVYGKPVDVWAIGCLFAEMLTGIPLFPGSSDLDTLHQILKLIGASLTDKQKEAFKSNPIYKDVKLPDGDELGIVPNKRSMKASLAKKLPTLDQESIDFLEKCLDLNPQNRWSTEQLMGHVYFKNFGARYETELRSMIEQETHSSKIPQFLQYIADQERNQRLTASTPISFPMSRENSRCGSVVQVLTELSEVGSEYTHRANSPRNLYPIEQNPGVDDLHPQGSQGVSQQQQQPGATHNSKASQKVGGASTHYHQPHSCSPPAVHKPGAGGVGAGLQMSKKYSPTNTFQAKRNSLSSIPNNSSPLGMNQIIVSSSSTSSFSGFPNNNSQGKGGGGGSSQDGGAQTSSGFFLSNTKLSSYLSNHQQGPPKKVNLTFSRPPPNHSPDWQTASTLSNQLKRTHNTSSTITALSSQPSGSFIREAKKEQQRLLTENNISESRRSPHIPLRHIPSTLSGTQGGQLHRQLSDGMRTSNNNNNYKSSKKTLPLIVGKNEKRAKPAAQQQHSFTQQNSSVPSQSQLNTYNASSHLASTLAQSPSTFRAQAESPIPQRGAGGLRGGGHQPHFLVENNENAPTNVRVMGGGKLNMMFTETDGFARRSVNKLSNNNLGFSNNGGLIRKPSDLRMPALPNINRYPSRSKVQDYSPSYHHHHHKAAHRNSKELGMSGAVKIIDLQSSLLPREQNIVYLNGGSGGGGSGSGAGGRADSLAQKVGRGGVSIEPSDAEGEELGCGFLQTQDSERAVRGERETHVQLLREATDQLVQEEYDAADKLRVREGVSNLDRINWE